MSKFTVLYSRTEAERRFETESIGNWEIVYSVW